MDRRTLTKLVTAGSMMSMAFSFYVLFGNHNWFGDRADLELDVAQLAQTLKGEQVLARYKPLNLRCRVEPSPLGAQACWGEIGAFNGVPARHVAFYFDAQQNLTAWKLAAEAKQYPALRAHFEQRYGAAQDVAGRPFLTQAVGGGVLALERQAPGAGETTVLWLVDPAMLAGGE